MEIGLGAAQTKKSSQINIYITGEDKALLRDVLMALESLKRCDGKHCYHESISAISKVHAAQILFPLES